MSETSGAWRSRLKSYKQPRGILRFVTDELKATPDPWQVEALLAYEDPRPDKRRVAMKACAGPGKTTVISWCGWWFLGCQGSVGEHPKGMATSITGDNLKDNLWPEFAKWQARSEYLRSQFTWTSSRIHANDHPETWFISSRSWPKTATPEEQGKTFSGLHAKYVGAFVDEAGAIPSAVGRAAEQALAVAEFAKLILGGNPISLEGWLHEACNRLAHLWTVITITGDPDDPRAWVHAPRLASAHVEAPGCSCPRCWSAEQIKTYGRDNPWVKAYILGQFPPSSINTLLGYEDVVAAKNRKLRPELYDFAQKRIGVDVARFGDDRSVLFPRQGLAAFRPVVLRNERTTAIAARVALAIADWHAELVLVDDTGHWGHGVIDNLITAGIPGVMGIQYHEKAIDPRYRNRRTEMWLKLAEWVKGGGWLCNVPDELTAELTTPTYTFVDGKLALEEKDQIKKRLGRSPDLGDALANTFGLPDMPAAVLAAAGQRGRTVHDFDPYADPDAGKGSR